MLLNFLTVGASNCMHYRFTFLSIFSILLLLHCGGKKKEEYIRKQAPPKLAQSGSSKELNSSENSIKTDSEVTEDHASDEAYGGREKEKKGGYHRVAGAKSPIRKSPTQSGLKAGYADDNKQYNYFVNFLSKYKTKAKHYPLDISERILLKIVDDSGKPIANAHIAIRSKNKQLTQGKSYADGSFYFYPSAYLTKDQYNVTVTYGKIKQQLILKRKGMRTHTIAMKVARQAINRVPVDIVFVFDTTASMGEEIARLKNTIELIELNISTLKPKPLLRFGMVLYKDRDDEYNTKVVPLTENLAAFKAELDKVEASGGGDIPENLQAALKDTMQLKWNTTGVRLAYIITDAPPHLDYQQDYSYLKAAQDAKAKGIKVFSIGTGGLDINGEFILRQIAQYTYGKYIFLTYGEKGESSGGKAGSVSHHTGAQFNTSKLESIIIRFTKEEISYLSDKPLVKGKEYFIASKISGEEKDRTLNLLFQKSLSQLVDYATIRLEPETTIAITPLMTKEKSNKATAEYFAQQLLLSARQNNNFKVVERNNMQAILREIELQQTGITEAAPKPLGNMISADLLLIGKLYKNEQYEIFLKLVRVETGEVLSVTKARLDVNLGLE